MPAERTKTTIYEVADRAGVAISTVSRVLNDSPDVARATRERVLDAIRDLKFRPNRTAKTLAAQQFHTLAVALPSFTTPFHTELLKGIRSELRERDIDLLLRDLGATDRHVELLRFLNRGAVSGLLIVGVEMTEPLTQELAALDAPVVLVGSRSDLFDCFLWDDAQGARSAVEHLIDRGHRRIAFIRSSASSPLQNERLKGYLEALASAGIDHDPQLVVRGVTEKHAGYSEEAGFEAMQSLLRTGAEFSAVFASSDVHAIGAMKAIRAAALLIPEDVALVGYDDIKTSQFIGLSSVDQSMQQIGRAATQVLLDRIEGRSGDAPRTREITPMLRVRSSSDFDRH
jgi:LacI family transcriptional regulator